MATMAAFLNRMLTVFLARVSPVSRNEKPRCMMNTRQVHTIIHVLFTTNITSAAVGPAVSSCPNAGMANNIRTNTENRIRGMQSPGFGWLGNAHYFADCVPILTHCAK